MDYCSKADSRQELEVRLGEPFICPECGKPLSAPVAGGSGGTNMAPILLGGGFLLIAAAGGLAAWMMFGHTRAPAPTVPPTAAIAPPATQAPTAQAPIPATSVAMAPAASADQTVLLRLRGDSALASTLAPALAAGFLTFSGDTSVAAAPTEAGVITVTGLRGGRQETISITSTSTEDGLASLGSGGADVALAARAITPAEKTSLAAAGDLTSPAAQHVVGLDGVAVIVAPGNDLTSVSVDQLRAVLDGSIKDWGDLGGNSADLHLLGHKVGDISLAPAANGAAVAAAVQKDTSALAIVALSDVGSAKALAITGKAQAVAPTKANITSGEYPLSRKLYFYTSPTSPNVLVQRFAEFAASSAGQLTVEHAGFIGTGAKDVVASAAPGAPATAQTALAGLHKINFEIHFDPNSTVPDVHAMRFIDGLFNLLVSEHSPPSKMVVVGFADSQGSEASNMDVSKKRADAIAAILTARGMTPGRVQAFGSQNPVADNGTEDGRIANRRVEIYLAP